MAELSAIKVNLERLPEEMQVAVAADADALYFVPVDRVHPNTWNPNVVAAATMAALEANIKRAGFNQPVLLRPHPTDADGNLVSEAGDGAAENDWQIVDGEHRWLTVKKLGRTYVLAIVRDIADADAKAQTVAMNKLRGEMDPADVARLVRETAEAGLAISEMAGFSGYTEEELEAGQKLLSFDWDAMGEAPTDADTPPDPDDRWTDLKLRVPQSVADIVNAELGRLLAHLGYEGQPDRYLHMAVELMAITSAQTPEANLGGD